MTANKARTPWRTGDGIRVMPDGMASANRLSMTNAVPGKASYVTGGVYQTLQIDSRAIHRRLAGASVMSWAVRSAAPVVQALRWLRPQAARDARVNRSDPPEVLYQS